MNYIGLDIGTSALKTTVIDETGHILHEASYGYAIEEHQEGYREIDPEVWYEAVLQGLADILQTFAETDIRIIGVTGQMHTTVFLDKEGKPVRKAIMWTDMRTANMVPALKEELAQLSQTRYIAQILSSGCPAMNTLWVKQNEPEVFARIRKIMTPYDYIVFRLTNAYSADYCDASTSSLYDIQTKRWSTHMLETLGLREDMIGPLHASCDIVGTLTSALCERFSITHRIPVIAGTGDNPANAVGMGLLHNQKPMISLGTSGVIILPKQDGDFAGKGKNVLFCAKGKDFVNVVQGTVRSAGGTHKWWVENIGCTSDMTMDQSDISLSSLGHNKVLFFPHITGDKVIYHDLDVRGAFFHVSAHTKRCDMTQAVFEGVSFALREVLESMELATWPSRIQINGGGTKSTLWMQIMASILHTQIEVVSAQATPGYGICVLAAMADGVTIKNQTKQGICYEPDAHQVAAYEKQYVKYKRLYAAIKEVMQE